MEPESPSSGAGRPDASPPGKALRPALKLPRRCAVAAWAGWLLSAGLLWGQHRLGVLHPWALLFLLLLTVTVFASSCGLLGALWRVVRGPKPLAALALALPCLAPVGLWAALAVYVLHLVNVSDYPKNILTNTADVAIASLMELQATYGYPTEWSRSGS